jgi:hypothetical protein
MSGAPAVTRQQLQAQQMEPMQQPQQQQQWQQQWAQQWQQDQQTKQKQPEDNNGMQDVFALLEKYWKLFL